MDGDSVGVYHTHVRSADVISRLKADGWFVCNVRCSHHQFKHPSKTGKITGPHPKADLPIGTARRIFRQAGLPWRS